jgi:hypothetical protein
MARRWNIYTAKRCHDHNKLSHVSIVDQVGYEDISENGAVGSITDEDTPLLGSNQNSRHPDRDLKRVDHTKRDYCYYWFIKLKNCPVFRLNYRFHHTKQSFLS